MASRRSTAAAVLAESAGATARVAVTGSETALKPAIWVAPRLSVAPAWDPIPTLTASSKLCDFQP